MSDFKIEGFICPKCAHYVSGKGPCRCKKYEYQFEDTIPDDWKTGYFQGDADDAAMEIAEQDFRDAGGDPSRYEAAVVIKDAEGKETKFNLSAEATVNFYAEEVALNEENKPV